MAETFLSEATRVVTELRRGNLLEDAKKAVNSAIDEASADRFYFNEMPGVVFTTVIGQEYYPDQGLVELDATYYTQGSARYDVEVLNQLDIDNLTGTQAGGPLQYISRYQGRLRLFPIPNSVYTFYVDGYGRLTPYPLVADVDTNAWLDDGERYIRALAKAILMKDIIRDYGEARMLEAIAGDYRQTLIERTAQKTGTSTLRSTQF